MSDEVDLSGFDDFDVAEGSYWFNANNHRGQGSAEYAALSASEFSPGPSDRGPRSEEAREVYRALWRHAHQHDPHPRGGKLSDTGLSPDRMVDCACCGSHVIGVPDMELCEACQEADCDPWATSASCNCPEDADADADADALSADDIREFNGYLRNCTDDQVRGVYEKERAAGRDAYAALAREAARVRGITL